LHFSSDDMFSLAGNGKHYKARNAWGKTHMGS
jgi:hypothetical protein